MSIILKRIHETLILLGNKEQDLTFFPDERKNRFISESHKIFFKKKAYF
jgi:hypothetical protein